MNRYAPFHGIIPLCPVERGTEDNATGTTTHARIPHYHFTFYTAMLLMICLHTLLPIFNGNFSYKPPPLYKGYFHSSLFFSIVPSQFHNLVLFLFYGVSGLPF